MRLARRAGKGTFRGMQGPSTKPKQGQREPVFVPHPDDAADVREAFDAIERGDILSPEASAAYLRSLVVRCHGRAHASRTPE